MRRHAPRLSDADPFPETTSVAAPRVPGARRRSGTFGSITRLFGKGCLPPSVPASVETHSGRPMTCPRGCWCAVESG